MSAIVSREPVAHTGTLRVLIVDDNDIDVTMLSRMVQKQFGTRARIDKVESGAAALAHLGHSQVDVMLVDYRLPDMDGLEILSHAAATGGHTAVILMTGQGNEATAVQAIKRGASDYLVKRDITAPILERAVTQAVQGRRIDRQHAREAEAIQQTTAQFDHYMRSLSHDMSANFMVLEHVFDRLKSSCHDRSAPALLEGVSHVEACLRESKRFVDDLVLLAKTGSVDLEPERVELSAVVAEVLRELQTVLEQRQAKVTVDPGLPAVWCNDARVRQVISNLLRNAVKHGCDRERPEITISQIAKPAGRPAGFVWLRIHDNGGGIPAREREAIFLPGRRVPGTQASGSGMGLAIVKQVMDHLSGVVYVDPQEPNGTAFVFSLPELPVTQHPDTQRPDARHEAAGSV